MKKEKAFASAQEAIKNLASSEKGLTQEQVKEKLEKFGFNEISEKKVSPFLKFLQYFWGPIPWMIEIAIILSAFVQDWTDFGIILLLLFTNAIVGFIEEHQADNAVQALKDKLAISARTLRDSNWKSIPSHELIPGDVIRLRMGDIVPADAILIESENLKVDQSALTGESLTVDKKEDDKIFSGSVIKQGESNAVVTGAGTNTFFGKTTTLVEETKLISHFQKAVLKIGNYLIIIALILVILILAVSLYRGDEFLAILRFCLVLTIAAIPLAMPTVLSVTMLVGARLLSKKQAIVRKLSSIEEMAGIDILCSDKTGTLTQNKLVVGDIFTLMDVSPDDVLKAACRASKKENDDPIDIAILNAYKEKESLNSYKMVHFEPFDPVHKKTKAQIHDSDGKDLYVTKGAPQVILNLSDATEDIKEKVKAKIKDFAEKGYRTLGVARSRDDKHYEFLGLIPLFDPPRDDSKATINAAKKMGIQIKMVTGDQEAKAWENAEKLGLGNRVLNASVFQDVKHHQHGRMEDQIENTDVFAEVYPEHKYHIVDVLQRKNHMVAMTGDGVNDAPALKKADAGIAVSGATTAARAASAIVLMEPGLSVIIDAIKESRKIFQRMNSYTIYRMNETVRILLFMTLSILTFNLYPVTAIMIVLLTLLNDGAILSIAYDNVRGFNKPEAWNMHLVFTLASVLGVLGVVEPFGVLYVG